MSRLPGSDLREHISHAATVRHDQPALGFLHVRLQLEALRAVNVTNVDLASRLGRAAFARRQHQSEGKSRRLLVLGFIERSLLLRRKGNGPVLNWNWVPA